MSDPRTITLCGSSRFPDAFALAEMHLSMRGNIVFGLSCYGHADLPRGAQFLTKDAFDTHREKTTLDQLHMQKIAMSDAIFVINPGGYVGASTRREIAYARELGKTIEWLFPPTTAELAEAGLETV